VIVVQAEMHPATQDYYGRPSREEFARFAAGLARAGISDESEPRS